MKTFIELFNAARAVSTPLTAIRTADCLSTIRTVRASLEDAKVAPIIIWDCNTGFSGLGDSGNDALAEMLQEAGIESAGATAALPVALGALKFTPDHSDLVVFLQNFHLQVEDTKPDILQGVLNLRDKFKGSGAMLVMLLGPGDNLPTELQNDTLLLDQPLPTREQLAVIVKKTFTDAAPKYPKCKNGATPDVIKSAVDALVGLPAFPADQSSAMVLDKENGVLDIETLWTRKRDIVSQNPGLTYRAGGLTLVDLYGVESFKNLGVALMKGKHSPTVVIRMDEIQRQLSGSDSDSSGTKGNLMGEFLTWVQDKNVICSLSLGVPGSSKSHSIDCIAGEFKTPVIDYSVPNMEHHHVGASSKHMRTAHRVLDAISDGRIWLVATANKLDGLPPELISRFQIGGIFFFDPPDEDEKVGILKLKIKKYKLDPKQQVPDMANWTGRDIDNCARKADILGLSLVESAKFVVPLLTSHKEDMARLRRSADGRFLSASKQGVYQFKEKSEHAEAAVAGSDRRMR